MEEQPELDRIRKVWAKYKDELLGKENVVGLGIGYREKAGSLTDEMVLTVMVQRKMPPHRLHPRDLVPRELDGVPVDVQEVGTLHAL
jgi:hypothetical protein